MYPASPDRREAKMIAILELAIIASPVNANNVIKMDMVNPIPAIHPIHKRCCFFISSGSTHQPNKMPSKEKQNIPIGFPRHKPRMIPKLFKEDRSCMNEEGIKIAVLANANKGRTRKATG